MRKGLFIASVIAGLVLVGCGPDEPEKKEKPIVVPDSGTGDGGEDASRLAGYKALKTYVDRTAHPIFRLGAAIEAQDFASRGKAYYTIVENFDEMTAENAMKYSSCVDDNGNMNFSTVKEFVAGAKSAGITIYGHTLAWHSQQRPGYLNKLLEGGTRIPLTSQEKKDTLTWALTSWIAVMMEATDGYVTAWDVVNEAISGSGDDGQGYYTLQSDDGNSANFFWQDYLGSIDYVRIAVKAARDNFKGKPEDLKLFINDYNLESDWDDNKKLKSLVHWIEKWESDGVTKIDGIGTQMHVSYYLNEDTQKSKEQAVVKSFELLAASGKLVKISELDMGIIGLDGKEIKTVNVTADQHRKMAEFYKFIVSKYMEIIPAAQQYGITQWCMTDSPSNSGWRADMPVGLWDLNFNRKPEYGGYADGLTN